MEKLLRLLLVFLNVVFLGLKTNLNIIAFFIAVIIRDYREVFLGFLSPILLEIVLSLVIAILELKFFYLRFFF